jgi:hypothetical protein
MAELDEPGRPTHLGNQGTLNKLYVFGIPRKGMAVSLPFQLSYAFSLY